MIHQEESPMFLLCSTGTWTKHFLLRFKKARVAQHKSKVVSWPNALYFVPAKLILIWIIWDAMMTNKGNVWSSETKFIITKSLDSLTLCCLHVPALSKYLLTTLLFSLSIILGRVGEVDKNLERKCASRVIRTSQLIPKWQWPGWERVCYFFAYTILKNLNQTMFSAKLRLSLSAVRKWDEEELKIWQGQRAVSTSIASRRRTSLFGTQIYFRFFYWQHTLLCFLTHLIEPHV